MRKTCIIFEVAKYCYKCTYMPSTVSIWMLSWKVAQVDIQEGSSSILNCSVISAIQCILLIVCKFLSLQRCPVQSKNGYYVTWFLRTCLQCIQDIYIFLLCTVEMPMVFDVCINNQTRQFYMDGKIVFRGE